ncbi:hypothetical protein [Massilia sp. Se16.2.3]|uniref:hypothetical protein n=1 Tax=Massilia sp. Se16.2.3 TaxID=2709303 RepID=UPI001E36E3F5|nr:hypothetical protein [Massilia sp. Se16.2.3]
MTVWVVPRRGLPRVDYVLAVRGAGFAADDSAHPGFANLLAGMINEGSAKRDSRAIAEAARAWAARWPPARRRTASSSRPMRSLRRLAR